MKTQYEFIHFELMSSNGKTSVWSCKNTRYGEELGEVRWYDEWHQYCYSPTAQAVYSKGCLTDISNFIADLMARHKAPEASE